MASMEATEGDAVQDVIGLYVRGPSSVDGAQPHAIEAVRAQEPALAPRCSPVMCNLVR